MRILVSVVIPLYNEEDNIIPLYEELMKYLRKYDYEIIFVDDGSSDGSLLKLKSIKNKDVKFISLARNFGHQIALKAGLDYSKGDVVISMDADLQHPPRLIDEFISEWQKGFDIVYSKRIDNKKESFFKKATSKMFYRVLNSISYIKLENGSADFRLLSRRTVDIVKSMDKDALFIRGVISWIGFDSKCIEYVSSERKHGSSKYNLRKMIELAVNGILNFTLNPFKFLNIIGFLMIILGVIYFMYILYVKLFTLDVIDGWASMMIVMLLFNGFIILSLGVIGNYIGRLFIDSKARPLYLIKEKNE